jgi:hypothetical protein
MHGSSIFISDNTLRKNNFKIHEALYFCSDRFEVSVLLGYGTVSLGDGCPTFRDNVVVLFSRVEMSEKIGPYK